VLLLMLLILLWAEPPNSRGGGGGRGDNDSRGDWVMDMDVGGRTKRRSSIISKDDTRSIGFFSLGNSSSVSMIEALL